MDSILPIKLIEALAAGKPTITSDIPIMREFPDHVLVSVKSHDPPGLAIAMERLSNNEVELESHSIKSRHLAGNYDIRKHVPKIYSLLLD